MRKVAALWALSLLVAGGCASRTAVCSWGYSNWYREGGGGEMGTFNDQRRACLEEAGISDPFAVKADSPAETRFLECMNGRGWCTFDFGCQKPGA